MFFFGLSLAQRLDGFVSAAVAMRLRSILPPASASDSGARLDAEAREKVAQELWDEWHAILTNGGEHLTAAGYDALKDLGRVAERNASFAGTRHDELASALADALDPEDDSDRRALLSANDLVQDIADMERQFSFWHLRHEALIDFVSFADEGLVMKWASLRARTEAVSETAPLPATYTERIIEYFKAVIALESNGDFDPDNGMMQYFGQVALEDGKGVTSNAVYFAFCSCKAWTKGTTLGAGRHLLERTAHEAVAEAQRVERELDLDKD